MRQTGGRHREALSAALSEEHSWALTDEAHLIIVSRASRTTVFLFFSCIIRRTRRRCHHFGHTVWEIHRVPPRPPRRARHPLPQCAREAIGGEAPFSLPPRRSKLI